MSVGAFAQPLPGWQPNALDASARCGRRSGLSGQAIWPEMNACVRLTRPGCYPLRMAKNKAFISGQIACPLRPERFSAPTGHGQCVGLPAGS